MFDVILSSPPKHAGEPRDLADRGWHAGPHYRDVAALFDQSRQRLNPGGRLYVMVSSDSDLALFGHLIDEAGFHARIVYEHSILIELFIIYELEARLAVLRRGRVDGVPVNPSCHTGEGRYPWSKWIPTFIGMAGGDSPRCLAGLEWLRAPPITYAATDASTRAIKSAGNGPASAAATHSANSVRFLTPSTRVSTPSDSA